MPGIRLDVRAVTRVDPRRSEELAKGSFGSATWRLTHTEVGVTDEVHRIGGGGRDVNRDTRLIVPREVVQCIDPVLGPTEDVLLLLGSALHSTAAAGRAWRGLGEKIGQREEIALTECAHFKICASVDTRVDGTQPPERKLVSNDEEETKEIDNRNPERPAAPTP